MAIATVDPTTGVIEREFAPINAEEVERRLTRAADAVIELRATMFAQRADWMRAAVALLANPDTVGASRAWTRYDPLGVVLAVVPWNYPLWQVTRFAALALMAVNGGLIKHASNVKSALYLDDLFRRGGFPVGAFQTLLIGSGTVDAAIRDPRVQGVALTPSEPAGRSVAATAGSQIKKLVLELGGSDHFIVHTEVYDRFAELFTAKVAAAVVGDPLEEATTIGPLATESGRDELAALVDDAINHGATARTGGISPSDGTGWFYPPIVLEGVDETMRLLLEEGVGSGAVPYRAADAVFILGVTISYPELPFGGIKNSGHGRELGAPGIREFCNPKTVWKV